MRKKHRCLMGWDGDTGSGQLLLAPKVASCWQEQRLWYRRADLACHPTLLCLPHSPASYSTGCLASLPFCSTGGGAQLPMYPAPHVVHGAAHTDLQHRRGQQAWPSAGRMPRRARSCRPWRRTPQPPAPPLAISPRPAGLARRLSRQDSAGQPPRRAPLM